MTKIILKSAAIAALATTFFTGCAQNESSVKAPQPMQNLEARDIPASFAEYARIKQSTEYLEARDIPATFTVDVVETGHAKKKKKRFVHKERDLGNFCFKDAHSIHYRASQRCK